MFIDRDGDGAYGAGDVGLANVPIRLWAASDYSALSAGPLTPDPFGQTIVDGGVHLVTGTHGTYRFDAVSAGAYVVASEVSLASFHYSFDTDGGDDWIVAVDVHGGQVAQARFAGISTEVLTGSVDLASLAGAQSLTCWWHGQDGQLGTADDESLAVPVDSFGNFRVTGVPDGGYTCAVANGSVSLTSQLPGGAGPSTTVPTTSAAPTGVLPQTGGDWSAVPAIGAAVLAVGITLAALARRRPRAVS